MLRAYLDASEPHQPPRVTVVAGYLAPRDEWGRVETAWSEELDSWKIDHFHLRHLKRQLRGEFAPACEAHFVGIIQKSGLIAIGAAVLNGDWEEPDWGRDTTVRLSSAYEQCLDFAFDLIGKYTNEIFPSEAVEIFCCLDKAEKKIKAIFNRRQRDYPHFTAIKCGSGKTIRLLQCADLGAGRLRRSWTAIARGDDDARDLPWGELPKGEGTRSRTAIWSLRQEGVLLRALKILGAFSPTPEDLK
jgi:hypothetical protein